jgi:hypothetical protein
MGVDDAYYLGIGANILAGRGLVSTFGWFPQEHSVLWPVLLQAPHAWFGIDPSAGAHALVVTSGAATIGLTGILARRCLPLAAPVAAAGMLGFPFLIDLGTGLGIDLPATALTLLYLVVGLEATKRGSIRMGIAAGVIFAVAFLIKEIALPFAPVPLFAGLVRGRPLPYVVSSTAAMLLAGVAGTSWWFVLYAQQVDTVYRLGTPAWTLVPIGLAIVVLGAAGLWMGRRTAEGGLLAGAKRRNLVRVGWLGALLWSVALTAFFSRSAAGPGGSFLHAPQLVSNLSTWIPAVGGVLAIGLVGGAIAVVGRVRRASPSPATDPDSGEGEGEGWHRLGRPDWSAVDDLLITTICGIPLVLLVVSIGESPRHYLVQIAALVALGATGWVWLAVRLLAARDRGTLIAAGLALVAAAVIAAPFVSETATRPILIRLAEVAIIGVGAVVLVRLPWIARRTRMSSRPVVAAIVLTTLTVAAGILALYSTPRSPRVADASKAAAVAEIAGWVEANVPRGTTVAFARILAFESAIDLQADYRTVLVRDDSGIRVDPTAPLGVRGIDAPAAFDWVALRASPTDVALLYGYQEEPTLARLRESDVGIWIITEVTGTTNSSLIVEALRHAIGAAALAHWEWPYGSARLETTIFRVEPDQLDLPNDVFLSRDALERIAAGLEGAGAVAAPAAAALAERAVVIPDDDQARATLERLRHVGAR